MTFHSFAPLTLSTIFNIYTLRTITNYSIALREKNNNLTKHFSITTIDCKYQLTSEDMAVLYLEKIGASAECS